ncbi:uncharacterized protein N7498_001710 [Penicillium cinerascens]|uniref:Uncharacterized protein n=1 Tax=Penicillium cinerascens TaxID=70096 RepID=A0A9W9MDS6_9EURO|nr:uncharacterized protein N7498_007877 [Penicillium cinerascens]XP_058311116.1 uncharacterized protein N7498_001710 [Penicillium cinerascens]KAJ5198760.1 hypothetical protein N7498_007877 [Penicillium cinerascens]KAJ5215303.1 hypothetical protein N7498_001710 [Penicillium cinerascens]
MPSQGSFPAILHIRDFIDHVEQDPTRPGKSLCMQLRVSLNIPDKDIQSDDVEQDDIPTLIRLFNEGNRPDLYQSNAFIYAWGSFLATSSDSDGFHILLHAHGVERHPGDQEDTSSYFMHCPEAALPVVTVLATVLEREGQLNTGTTLLHYRLQSTVYNSSTRSHNTFPLTAYFKNGQRWVNFPPLSINTNIFLTGRIFGITKNNRQLAVITDDIHFLPTQPQSLPSTPSPTASKRKRQDRWSQRANTGSPLKPAPVLEDDSIPTLRQSYSPTGTTSMNNDGEGTLITWPDTTDDGQPLPQPRTPTPEPRSQRSRKRPRN